MFEKRKSGLLIPTLAIGGSYRGSIVRDGKIIERFEDHNVVVYQGLDALLATMFTSAAQVTSWYLGIYSGNYAPTANDTAATIPGNSTESTAYTNATRVPYVATEGGQQTTNVTSPASFNFNAPATIYGAFLISSSGKGSTSGTLFSATGFQTPKTVAAGDQLNLTYVVAAASS